MPQAMRADGLQRHPESDHCHYSGGGGAVSNTARQIHGVDSDTINFCFFFPLRLKEPLNFVGVLDTGASFIQACLSFSIV